MRDKLTRLAFSKWAPWILFGLSLSTRIAGAVLGGDHSDDGDNSYRQMAVSLLGGQGLSIYADFGRVYSWLPPGMGLIFAGFISVFGPTMFPLRAAFILLSALANVWMFLLAKRLLAREWAYLAALIWALYPPQWFWASRVNPQTYATDILILCVLLLFISWETKRHWLGFVIGILWGSMALCRGEYVLGFVVLAGASLFAVKPFSHGLKLAVFVVLGWTAVFGPWIIRNYQLHQGFVLVATNYGDNFWKAYNPAYDFSGYDIPFPPELSARLKQEPNEIGRAEILKAEALKFIRENPGRAARNIIGNALNFWRPWLSAKAASPLQNIVYVISFVPIFFLFLWGLAMFPVRNHCWWVILGLIFYKFSIHIPFYVIVRYREAIFPLLVLVAMLPIQKFGKRATEVSHDQ
jgi:4-amino-4-deoxy-L-arabinose transferase-like glycosyltransferase